MKKSDYFWIGILLIVLSIFTYYNFKLSIIITIILYTIFTLISFVYFLHEPEETFNFKWWYFLSISFYVVFLILVIFFLIMELGILIDKCIKYINNKINSL